MSEKGYVYILTNPSFREDWIKIGKSRRRVDTRIKELDNTSIPLPFEIYATIKSASYHEIESMLHTILEGTDKRIRSNREFFNVKPEMALEAFYSIAKLVHDAEVFLKGEEPSDRIQTKATNIKPKKVIPFKEIHSTDELPKNGRYTLDGVNFYSMARFAYAFIKQLILDKPSLTFSELEAMFPTSILSGYRYCGVVVRKHVLEAANLPIDVMNKAYRYDENDSLLQTQIDRVEFYTTTQWMRDSFKKLLAVAEKERYKVYIKE